MLTHETWAEERILGGVEVTTDLFLLVTAGTIDRQDAVGLEVLQRVNPPDRGWEARGQIVLPVAALCAAGDLLRRAAEQVERPSAVE